ncbi:bZIP transcription factor 53-like [Miscanthus floridulus]|uniref:bZIP transcription factor 53-like n=1 Tax=Miscanthus floridulus TaxID=154761 RepID=UPI0034580CC9
MAFSGCMTCIDMQISPAMAKQHAGFGSDHTAGLFPTKPAAAAAASWPEVDAVATAAECVDQRRFRRRISNRESTRQFRARKRRHLDELRDSAALLECGNRDLAARAEAACDGLALALLANAALRAEAAALSRRLAAARRALVLLGRVYAGVDAVASVDGDCCLGSTDIEIE